MEARAHFFRKGQNKAEKGQKKQKKGKNAQDIQKIGTFFNIFEKSTLTHPTQCCKQRLVTGN